MQASLPPSTEESFSKLFPTLKGDELSEGHRRFRNYVELALEIYKSTFDKTDADPYPEITKVDSSPTINQKQQPI